MINLSLITFLFFDHKYDGHHILVSGLLILIK